MHIRITSRLLPLKVSHKCSFGLLPLAFVMARNGCDSTEVSEADGKIPLWRKTTDNLFEI